MTDKVISITTKKELFTTEKVSQKVKDLDRCIAVGLKDDVPHVIVSEGYSEESLLFELERTLMLLKMEMFGFSQEFDDYE